MMMMLCSRVIALVVLWTQQQQVVVGSSMTVEEALLKDIMYAQGSSKCSFDSSSSSSSSSTTTFVHTPSPSQWNVSAANEEHAFLAAMTHSDTSNEYKSWTVRFGTGGSIYSLRNAVYGEAIPPQTKGDNGDSIFVDEVIQAVTVDLSKNNNPMPHFIHQAGAYFRDSTYLDQTFYSPNVAKYCNDTTCLFATWGQIAAIPTVNKSEMLYVHQYTNCGEGVMEYVQMYVGEFGDDRAYLNIPWGGVRESTLPDLYFSSPTDGSLENKQDPIQRFGIAGELLLPLGTTGGYSTFAQSTSATAAAALAYVHGTCPEYQDSDNRYLKASNRIRFGRSTRDFTVFTINGQFEIPNALGQRVYVNRQYLINNELNSMASSAANWVEEARGELLTPADFTNAGRTAAIYVSNDESVFGVAVAAKRGVGGSTTCGSSSTAVPQCVGSTVPTEDNDAWFVIKCGTSITYVGPDKYALAPPVDATDGIVRSYVCDGLSNTVPQWTLIGYYPSDDCTSVQGTSASYDPHFCTTTDTPTDSPTDTPTESPTYLTDNPTESPTNTTETPTESPTNTTEAPTESPTTLKPTIIDICTDDSQWTFNQNQKKNCNWVVKKPNLRCRKISSVNDVVAHEACPIACKIIYSPKCVIPKCRVDTEWKFRTAKQKLLSCKHFNKRPNNCKKKIGIDSIFAYEACQQCKFCIPAPIV